MINPRTDYIRSRLVTHFADDLELPLVDVPPEEWAAMLAIDHPCGPTAIAGWAWPCWLETPNNIIVTFCFERITEVTADLTVEDLDDYLDLIEYMCDLHIAYWDLQDPWLRHQRVMDEVAEKFPGSLELLQIVGVVAAA